MVADNKSWSTVVRSLFLALLGFSLMSCNTRSSDHNQGEELPIIYSPAPGDAGAKLTFRRELAASDIEKLRNAIGQLHVGASVNDVTGRLGPPSRDEVISSKERPNVITGRLLYYEVRLVHPPKPNAFDQYAIFVFDTNGHLLRVVSTTREIHKAGG